MKKNIIRLCFALCASFFAACLALQSCSVDDGMGLEDGINGNYPNALVTVRTSTSGNAYFQLDEKTTLEPVGWKNPYKSITRALMNYSEISGESAECSKMVRVNWIDSVLTKDAVVMKSQDLSSETGNDPVEIVNDWMTVCEDGFLTIHFATMWGEDKIPHKVSLGVSSDNPYEFHFRHDKSGDYGTYWNEGLVAFRIEDLVPDTKGEEVNLTLNWKSFSGSERMAFKYKTRE